MQLGQQHARHSRPISSQSQHARLRAKPRSMAAVDASRVSCDVAVIGSGLGGLAVAAGMRHRLGLDVQVYEAAASLGARSTTGTLIGLGANSFAALQELHPGIVAAFK